MKATIAMEMTTAMATPSPLEPEREVPKTDGQWLEERTTRERIQQQQELLAQMLFAAKCLTSQRTRLHGSMVATQAALKGVERELGAVTGVYDCVQERVDVLLTATDELEAQVAVLTSDYEAVEFEFGELWQEVVGLRGERAELQDVIADFTDELQFIKRVVKVETAFLLAQPRVQQPGDAPRSSSIKAGGIGAIASFWWSLVWPF